VYRIIGLILPTLLFLNTTSVGQDKKGDTQIHGTWTVVSVVATMWGGVSLSVAGEATTPKPDTQSVNTADATRIRMLVERLKGSLDDPAVQMEASRSADSLIGIGAAAVPQLSGALADDDRNARVWAAYILNEIGSEAADAAPALTKALADEQTKVRLYSARALGRIGSTADDVVAAVIATLEDENCDVRHDAAGTLLILVRKDKALGVLRRGLADPDVGVRCSAALAAGRAGPTSLVLMPELIHTLQDKNSSVRTYAAKALGKIGPTAAEAVPHLAKRLKSTGDGPESEACMEALRDIGPTVKGVVPALIWALTQGNKPARPHAAVALGRLRAAEAVPHLIAALDDPDSMTRMCAARALGEIGPPAERAISLLTKVARNDESSLTREVAQRAIKMLRANPQIRVE
jgi:HEAT repeat protein